ncbi:MAG: hypothetical protein AABW82_02340 [Nanoarchaeota archaeon]
MDSDKEKRKFIIDTSAFTVGSNEKIDNGLANRVHQGLFAQSEEPLDILNQHGLLLAELDNFFRSHDSVFINEVLKENGNFISTLKEKIKVVSDYEELARDDDENTEFNSQLRLYDRSFAKRLENYVDNFTAFNAYFRRRAFCLDDFNPLQKLVYDRVLEKARRIHLSHKERGDKQTPGDRLETDRKLIATSIAMAVKYPVTLISRDIQLIGEPNLQKVGSLRKVIEECRFWTRTSDGLNVNPQEISVYNPNRSDNGFYDSEKERVVYERRNN